MKNSNKTETRTNLLIILLGQAVVYTSLWLWNEYVATYLTLIFPGVILFILILAIISDLIEPSRIPGWYYGLMVISIITPVIIGAVFYYINDGRLEWLQ